MEREGYVSIWLGNFADDDALMEYAGEDGYDKDGNESPSRFTADFFGGEDMGVRPRFLGESGGRLDLRYCRACVAVFLRRYFRCGKYQIGQDIQRSNTCLRL